MLSLFPTLLSYELLAAFLLRLTLGATFIHWSYGRMKHKDSQAKVFAVIEGILGVMLVLGAYTQAVAIATSLLLFIQLVRKIQTRSLFTDGVNYYFILFVISLSLLVLGAGAFAFDLPL